jgi:TRAP-type C4-dicarboxylate transport system permease small subunit
MPDPQSGPPELAGRRLAWLASRLALTGGAILLGIAVLVTTSVLLRLITGEGISGDFEIVQLAAAIAAFCMFPLCFSLGGNIVVDSFTTRLPSRVNRLLDGTWNLLFGFIAAILCWRMAVGAMDQLASRTTLQVLPVPTWWAIAACALLVAFLAGTTLAIGIRQLRGRR